MKKRSKREINLTREDLQSILDHSFDEIYVIDSNANTIYVNEACGRHYGATPDELIGKPVQYLEERGYCSPVLAPVFLNIHKRFTLQQSTAFGKILTVTSTPVFDENKNLKYVVLNSRDITDITEFHKDLENSRRLVEQYRGEIAGLEKNELTFAGIIADSPQMRQSMNIARKIASVDTDVLILGESGTGKNLMANYIHNISRRRTGKFIQVNCASIPENLLESELFGYCKGAFSGAEKKGKPGLAKLADGGTLFLDEIGELPLCLQAKILQLVQEHSFIPLGGTEKVHVDIRIIAATNRDLQESIQAGTFREDLYYRLSVLDIKIPPVRERLSDIPLLVNYYLNKLNSKYHSYISVSADAMRILEAYPWPGNVREMEHLLERLVLLFEGGEIQPKDLPDKLRSYVSKSIALGKDSETKIVSHANTSFREMEIERILSLYKTLKSSYKVAEEMHISQSKATRIINKFYKNRTDDMDMDFKKVKQPDK